MWAKIGPGNVRSVLDDRFAQSANVPAAGALAAAALDAPVSAPASQPMAQPAPRRAPLLAVAAAAAVAAVVSWQFVALPLMTGTEPGYGTASGPAGAEFTVTVGFAANASMAQIQALLTDTGGRVIDGPSALGLWQIAFDSAAARDGSAELALDVSDPAASVFSLTSALFLFFALTSKLSYL